MNPGFTVHFEGWTIEESAPLLAALYHHAVRPEHCHRFQWSEHSAVLWDNRAVWHCALNDYQGQYRLMHRVTIDGVELEAAAEDVAGSRGFADDNEGETPLEVVNDEGQYNMSWVRLGRTTKQLGLLGEGEAAAFPVGADELDEAERNAKL